MKYKRKKEKEFWQLARSCLHDYMPITRNLSDKSVEAYKRFVETYIQFLEVEKSLVEDKVTFRAFSRENITGFVSCLKGKEYASKTINLRLIATRSFLK